ncbi:hypothetical protein AABM38_14015 [Heyndrickxia sp. MSNUG]|uniref:hypothetical protein n=1 Tax=Heyndrickxia sp. MSNUG TaxID=3136677 RepID=UPI003C2B25C5
MQPASIFIMDISKSSSAELGEKLSSYLSDIEEWINKWFHGYGHIQVRHRSGDELIFLAEGYATAFVTAFFISRLWKFENNKPYFGMAFGSIDKSIEEIDIEKWIHPVVKQARLANDFLKKQKERETFHFDLDGNIHVHELVTLLNGMLKLQNALSKQQTDVQRLVCSLYLVYEKQNVIAELLERSAPTIYSHYKKGHSELVLGSYQEVSRVLASLQTKEFGDATACNPDLLEGNIRKHVKGLLNDVFNL